MRSSKTNRQSMGESARSLGAYAFALLPVTITVAARFTCHDETGLGPSLTLLIVPVLVASWLGGQGAGFLATGLAGVAWVMLYVPQFGSIHVDCVNNIVRLVLFLIAGGLASRFIRPRPAAYTPAEARLRRLAARDEASSVKGERFGGIEQARSARSTSRMILS
jgi:K+-sensing histidine kinase KdpD